MAASGGIGNLAKAEAGLKSAREKLSTLVENRFSKTANKKIWQDQSKHIPKEPEASDSNAIQAAKNALLFLKEMEDMVHGMNSFSQKSIAGKMVTGPALAARKTAAAGWTAAKGWWAGNKSWREIGTDVVFGKHFTALMKQAEAAGLPTDSLTKLSEIFSKALSPEGMQAALAKELPNLTASVSSFFNDYLEHDRPVAPKQPEQEYKMVQYGPGQDWNPAAQESHEWFQLMLEPMRKAMSGTLALSTLLDDFLKEAESKGQVFDKEQMDMIEKTRAALSKASLGEDGYYIINEKDETPLSESLKGLFNLMWAINQLCSGFWDEKWHSKTGVLEKLSANVWAGVHGKKALANYFHIKFPELGGQLGILSGHMFNAMLFYGNEMVTPQLAAISNQLHSIELNNDLRLGALSDDFRGYLDPLVWLGVDRGIVAENPFGFTHAKETALKSNEEKNRNKPAEAEKFREAGDELKTLRREAAMQKLREQGLNGLLRATVMATNFEKLNLPQKRTLAAIKADLDSMPRKASIDNAHVVAVDFAKEAKIKEFITAVNTTDETLAHSLAVETMIGGFIPIPIDFGSSLLPNKSRGESLQDLIHVLDRMEASQILEIYELKNDQSEKRAVLLNMLIKNNRITPQAFQEEFKNSGQYSLEQLVKDLSDRYLELERILNVKYGQLNVEVDKAAWLLQQPERVAMNKIGLMLGRLARENEEVADVVFGKNIQAKVILMEQGDGSVVYYESLVNSLKFNYVADAHDKENREFREFVKANESVILAIHHSMTLEALDDKEIVENYRNNPASLMELLDQFIKTKLSVGSKAENKVREFLSAALLTRGEKTAKLRDEILTNQLADFGSMNAKYVNRLTIRASFPYWQILRNDLIEKAKARKIPQDVLSRLNNISDKDEKRQIEAQVQKFFAAKKAEFDRLGQELLSKKEELSLHVRTAQQKMNAMDEELGSFYKMIEDKVKILQWLDTKQEESTPLLNIAKTTLRNYKAELPVGLEKQIMYLLESQRKLILGADISTFATVSARIAQDVDQKFNELTRMTTHPQEFKDTRGLEKTVDEIINQLQGYVKKRTGSVSDMHKLFGSGLRDEKNKLAREYEKIFAGFAAILKEPNLTEEKYQYCVTQVNSFVDKLLKDHEALMTAHGKKEPAKDELMKRINNIQKMTFPLKKEIDERLNQKKKTG